MVAQRLTLRCEPFARLLEVVRDASLAAAKAAAADQARYLMSYLQHDQSGAKTIIVEKPYVDRHWLEAYAGYYATMLRPPPPKATRLHFLRAEWSDNDLLDLVRRAATGERAQAEAELRKLYLGFAVIRPLPSAPLGRTILRPYQGDAARCFAAANVEHQVHLCGLTVRFSGLPFQQQDQGVGACATTALWCALTKVMRSDGNRSPTPFAITISATDHRVQARAFPAVEGLDLDQMATAIHAHGYQSHLIRPAEHPDVFVMAIKTYLRSGIPVIVRVRTERGESHALTFSGFRDEPELGDKDVCMTVRGDVHVRSRGVVRWYVHDDRLGPYARLGFPTDENGTVNHQYIELMPREPGFEDFKSRMFFSEALIPLYPKLRLTAEELIEFSFDLRPPICLLSESDMLHVEPRFVLGGEYLRELQGKELDIERVVAISTQAVLSRYVGVLSWYVEDEWICDALYDTTDLRRDSKTHPPLIAIVPKDPAWIDSLENMRDARFGPSPLIA